MPYWSRALILGTFAGVTGTALGGAAGFFAKRFTEKRVGACLGFSSGIMLALVLVELLPFSFATGGAVESALALAMGILAFAVFERIRPRGTNKMRRVGAMIAAAIAEHNFPEGMAIGAGLRAGGAYTLLIVLALWLHDIPEGMSVAVPLRSGGSSAAGAFFYAALAGVPTGLGALTGALLGESPVLIAACMAFAGGAMLAVTLREMLPEYKETSASPWALVVGAFIGIALAILL